MITIDQAIDKVLDARRTRQDIQVPASRFNVSTNGKNVIANINGREYVPTEHALKQMANWTGVSHSVLRQYCNPVTNQNGSVRYERDERDMELLVNLFENGMRDGRVNPDKEFKFRTYNDGTLRAMVSDRYAIIDNVWYLEMLKDAFSDHAEQPVFEHFRGDADTIFGDLRVPAISKTDSDSDYGGMLFIGNCEIGKHRIAITPAVWRQVCTNGMMGWAKEQRWSKVHRGEIDLTKLANDITCKIDESIPILNEGITKLLEAKNMALKANPSEIIAQIAYNYKLSTGQTSQAVESVTQYGTHESNFRNLFGIVNAVTRAAQLQKDPAEQFRLEEIGGRLISLNDKEWNRLNQSAMSLDKEKVDKAYGIVAV